ncbi:polysaccharide deacetylase family protein [Kurthia gibsonii]|uniref:polysaccharide deacetylase family protein n=1 Tax=Kurthia gibsonii TaxID=33946 RepID=UPI0039836F5F
MKSSPFKNRLLIDSLLVCILLSLIIFAVVYMLNLKSPSEKGLAASTENTSTAETDDPFIKTVTVTNATEQGSYTIQYPKTGSSELNTAISDAVKEMKTDFFKGKYAKDTQMHVTYMTLKHKDLYSFVLTQSLQEDKQKKDQKFITFTVDQPANELIDIKEVIPSGEQLTHIMNLSQKELAKHKEVQNFNKSQQKDLAINQEASHFENFALDDQNLYFYLNPDSFTSSFNQPITITLPLQNINSSLAKEFQIPVKKIIQKKKKPIPKKAVALTFDDGPNTTSTKSILATLKREKVKATFFMVGTQARANPKMVKQIADEGHELGNHSLTHANLVLLSNANVKKEIETTNQAIKKATGKNPTVFRPPYGSYNANVSKIAKMPVVLWNVDTLDWKHHNPQQTLANVKSQKSQYTTVLMHDIHASSAQALPQVIRYLKQQGYTFVTASEMLSIEKRVYKK